MTNATFQFPPDLFGLLVDTIPVLCKSKKDLILFFRGAGIHPNLVSDIEEQLKSNRDSVKKFDAARTILTRMNEGGDALLGARRELIKRVTEFEDFSRCYDNDVMKARGLVAEVRRIVQVKDAFTRMSNAHDREIELRRANQQEKMSQTLAQNGQIAAAKADLFRLFGETNPHVRGKALETTLNSLFKAYNVLVAENFQRTGTDNNRTEEQIDGVIEIDAQLYLVEMKWWNAALGPNEISPHINRLFLRNNVHGIFISSSEYTMAALSMCRDLLQQRVIVLCTLREIVDLLTRDGDLVTMLRAKIRAAKLDRNPFKEVIS